MKKIKIATMGLCMLTIFSCSTKQGTGSLIGAGGGALLGGIIGKIAGNTAVGAAIGGAVGAGKMCIRDRNRSLCWYGWSHGSFGRGHFNH